MELEERRTKNIEVVGGTEIPAAEPTPKHAVDGQPVTVFERLAELQHQVDEAQAKIEQRRASDRERSRRWRERNPERARALTNARVQAYRARQRQAGT